MDIKQIRRENMLALIGEEKSQAEFARKAGTDPAYISQILSTKTKAEMGNALARAVEKAYKLPHGWMDQAHGAGDLPIPTELVGAWGYLLPNERAELEADIKRRAAHNKAVGEMLATKPEADKPPPKMPGSAVVAGPPTAKLTAKPKKTGARGARS